MSQKSQSIIPSYTSNVLEKDRITLSRYFPKGTEYFCGYPAQENSHFYNTVPPEVEELVAARPLICAGPDVSVICYPASLTSFARELLQDRLGVITLKPEQVKFLPEEVTSDLKGNERNGLLTKALELMVTPGKFIMAQPYLRESLNGSYQMSPDRLLWLNDKKNMFSYMPKEFLPQRYSEFLDGKCFATTAEIFALPCVVKVSSSSAGDGVRICFTNEDLSKAKQDFLNIIGVIVVDEYIDAVKNIGIQFGISCDRNQPVELIGWHEQLTNGKGVFLGGIIDYTEKNELIASIWSVLSEKILPSVRDRGWFGVGGFDVLISKEGKFLFVDPNFRMTGMTDYHSLVRNGFISEPVMSFTGTFRGTEQEFLDVFLPISQLPGSSRAIYLTALTVQGDLFRFSAGMLYGEKSKIPEIAAGLLGKGIESRVLKGCAGTN